VMPLFVVDTCAACLAQPVFGYFVVDIIVVVSLLLRSKDHGHEEQTKK
jgi:hypothetical protein